MEPEAASKIVLIKDRKFIMGVILVILSFLIGTTGKGLFIFRYYKPVYLITGLSMYAFSWILFIIGVFLIGKETLVLLRVRFQNRLKEKVRGSYNYTKDMHKKGYERLARTSKSILKKVKN